MKRFTIFTVTFIAVFALQLNAQITLDLKVFLEGPFNGTAMNTTLNAQNLIPLSQPYNVTPWNYDGNEQVSAIPNTGIVDWVLVELRETTGGASTATPDKMIDRQAAFIKADGSIVGTNGSSMIIYSGSVTGNLFVIIWHRNHLAIMSSTALTNAGGIYSFNFTNQLSKAYLDGQKLIGTSAFGMIAGDCDGNGRIFTRDKMIEWHTEGGEFGYYQSDLNFDSQVDNNDKDDYWEPNFDLYTKIPAYLNWECFMDFTDARDGQVYSTVEIGTQCWMAENLNVGNLIGALAHQTNNKIIEKYCYNNMEANCAIYGGLYQWDELMNYTTSSNLNPSERQGICPIGWHLPSDDDWCQLEVCIDATVVCSDTGYIGTNVGGKMKESGLDHWQSPNTGATNSSGFKAIAGGFRFGAVNFQFGGLLNNALFWSTTENSSSIPWRRHLIYDSESGARDSFDPKTLGFSARCIKDPAVPSSPQPPDGAINQPLNTILSWTCSNPDYDILTFEVQFGLVNPPPSVSSNQINTEYNPGMLQINTPYYWKIIAHDSYENIIEGPVWSFTTETQSWSCGTPIIDVRDDQYYNTVQIGNQCWMAENLNIGTVIPGATQMLNNSIIEKYCYDNSTFNCDAYGALYQWNEMMQYSTSPGVQGICPENWHVPTDAEWTTLTTYLGGESIAGGKMKTTGTIEASTGFWYAPNTGATNTTGFTTIPGGFRYEGSFYFKGNFSNFFSSSGVDAVNSWYRGIVYNGAIVYRDSAPKNNGFSVRCIRDTPPTWSCGDVLNDTRDNQTYNTVQIGDQCWMSENLNIGTRIEGIAEQTNNTILEKYCYDDLETNCDTYGGLYQWNEMMHYLIMPGIQGICPTGWHLPTQNEYTTLINFLGSYTIVGGMMKEPGYAHWNEPNIGATNSSGFTALGSAGRAINGQFYILGTNGFFWTSQPYDASNSFRIYLNNASAELDNYYSNMPSGFSVRCLKD